MTFLRILIFLNCNIILAMDHMIDYEAEKRRIIDNLEYGCEISKSNIEWFESFDQLMKSECFQSGKIKWVRSRERNVSILPDGVRVLGKNSFKRRKPVPESFEELELEGIPWKLYIMSLGRAAMKGNEIKVNKLLPYASKISPFAYSHAIYQATEFGDYYFGIKLLRER